MLFFLFVIICGLFITWEYFQRKRNRLLLKTKNIPDGAVHYPIIGAGYLVIGKLPEDIFNMAMNLITTAPSSICKLFIFTKLIITVKNPSDIQKILSSPQCLEKGTPYTFFPFKNGLITAKPDIWKSHRKLLNPTFHLTLLQNTFMQQFNEIAQLLVSDLRCKIGGGMFNIEPFISYRTTDLLLRGLFDAEIQESKINIIYGNTKKALEIMGEKALKLYKYFVFYFMAHLLKFDLLGERIMNNNFEHMEPFYKNARNQYLDKLKVCDSTEEDIRSKPEMFIDKLATLVERNYFTRTDMKDHIVTMLLAGSDTLTVALSNCILGLAMNPDDQDKCAREIKDVIGDQFDTISSTDLVKLQLLDRTINECMRLLPTVPIINRTCDKDFQLDDDKIIPAGTDIMIPIIVVQQCKEYWGDNPTKFNPDNFLPENIAKRPLLSYMPFSYGNRNCIAKKYAQHALKVLIAHLLVNYRFTTDIKFDDLKLAFGITLILRNKHMIRIAKR